ncbi:MAG TPA: SCO family protein [Brumimicrobium sp.]|nr:SCO family protein [Brumimicrobium sp.]
MTEKKKKGSFVTKLLLILVLFGPGAFILYMFYSGGVDNKYQELPVFSEMGEFEFVDSYGELVNNESQKDMITLFTTIQTSCPQNCALDLFKFNLLVYQGYKKNHKKMKHVKIVSIVTDENGNPVDKADEVVYMLKDLVNDYDSSIWKIVNGDPKQVYDIESNGINLFEIKVDTAFAQKAYLETMLIVDKENKLRLVRKGDTEGMIRDFKQHVALLQEQYDREAKALLHEKD